MGENKNNLAEETMEQESATPVVEEVVAQENDTPMEEIAQENSPSVEEVVQPPKKSKKGLLIAVAVIVVILAAFGGYSVMKSNNYKSAVAAYEAKEYDKAIEGFSKLGNYKEGADYLVKSKYGYAQQLQSEEKYDDAISIYEEIKEFRASNQYIVECTCGKAANMIKEQNYAGAKEILSNYSDNDIAKKMLDVCNVNENGMDGLISYMKENITTNSSGNYAEGVDVDVDGESYHVLLYYNPSTDVMKIQTEKNNKSKGDPCIELTLSGDKAGYAVSYMSNLTKVSAYYAYYNDTLQSSDGGYSIGWIYNADTTYNLKKFTKKTNTKLDGCYAMVSSGDKPDKSKESKEYLKKYVKISLEGLQQFLNEQELQTSIKRLGIEKYELEIVEDTGLVK